MIKFNLNEIEMGVTQICDGNFLNQKEIDMNFWCKFNKNKYFQNDLFQFLLGDFGDITLN